MNQPWECTRCHKINAPWLPFSDCKLETGGGSVSLVMNEESKTFGYFPTNCEHKWVCLDDQYNTRKCLNCGEKRTGEI